MFSRETTFNLRPYFFWLNGWSWNARTTVKVTVPNFTGHLVGTLFLNIREEKICLQKRVAVSYQSAWICFKELEAVFDYSCSLIPGYWRATRPAVFREPPMSCGPREVYLTCRERWRWSPEGHVWGHCCGPRSPAGCSAGRSHSEGQGHRTSQYFNGDRTCTIHKSISICTCTWMRTWMRHNTELSLFTILYFNTLVILIIRPHLIWS